MTSGGNMAWNQISKDSFSANDLFEERKLMVNSK